MKSCDHCGSLNHDNHKECWCCSSSDLSACLGADAQLADKASAVSPRLGDGLLPCPFCGKPVNHPLATTIGRSEDGHYGVVCNYCESSGPSASTKKIAQLLWNKRAGGSQAKATHPESHDG